MKTTATASFSNPPSSTRQFLVCFSFSGSSQKLTASVLGEALKVSSWFGALQQEGGGMFALLEIWAESTNGAKCQKLCAAGPATAFQDSLALRLGRLPQFLLCKSGTELKRWLLVDLSLKATKILSALSLSGFSCSDSVIYVGLCSTFIGNIE
jgi:hypothetical protein